jgi:16S rRNA processing protein RimM
VRGEVRVHPWNPDSSLLAEIDSVLVLFDAEPRRVAIRAARKVPKGFILALDGVHDCEGAEALRSVHLGLPREALPPLEEDELYLVDLVGLAVVQEGRRIGEVIEVLEYPSIECLRVECEDGFREIPLQRPWVEDVDVEAGEVRVGDLDDVPLETRRGAPGSRDATKPTR